MSVISIRSVARELGRLLPESAHQKIKDSSLGRKLIESIWEFDQPKKIYMKDGSKWERIESCPKRLLDPGGAQIGNRMYVICGFSDQATISNQIHVLDMDKRKWIDPIKIPHDLPHSHSAVANDGKRFIYIAGGQHGPNCRPAVSSVYCLDVSDNTWHSLPPLPSPRYAGTMQIWKGKLHYVGGADVDRWTPRAEHWSLRISGSEAVDEAWVEERPIPIPGMHRSSAVVNDRLYVIGGQQGDFKAIDNDPNYTCTGRTKETYLGAVFRLDDPDREWQRMADLPIAVSHCDFSCLVIKEKILLYGGQIYKHPEKFYLRLTDAIQVYDTETDTWAISGYLPYHLKMPVLGYHKDQVFITVGQRGMNSHDSPGEITSKTWISSSPSLNTKVGNSLPAVKERKVLLISHELTRSGAPLELLELGEAMIESGADVRLVTLKGDMDCGNVAADFRVPVVPPETAVIHAADADLIVVNTSHELVRAWVEDTLAIFPDFASKILWLIHEIDIEDYGNGAPALWKVRSVVFDSTASLLAWDEIGGAPESAHVVHPGLPDKIFAGAAQPKHHYVSGLQRFGSRAPKLLSRSEIRSALKLSDDDLVVLCVGSVGPRKGQEMLLRAVAHAARGQKIPLKLILIGFRSEEHKRSFIKRLGPDERQVFNARLGYTLTPYIDALYAASDIHVLNSQGSHGRGETFGRATVHAMAFHLPVLGTNAGGTPEIVEDGIQGFVYPIGEAGKEILIDRLLALANNSNLRKKMGEAAESRARRNFSKDLYFRQINNIIESMYEHIQEVRLSFKCD